MSVRTASSASERDGRSVAGARTSVLALAPCPIATILPILILLSRPVTPVRAGRVLLRRFRRVMKAYPEDVACRPRILKEWRTGRSPKDRSNRHAGHDLIDVDRLRLSRTGGQPSPANFMK